jgi:nicotinamide mononucleotide transporter
MEAFLHLFSINKIFFTVLGYQMSYLEFFGTLLNLWSVWLVTRNNILTWPIGNIAVILFAVLFYQIHLYSDFVEQIYFLVTGFYGWWAWIYLRKTTPSTTKQELPITSSSPKGKMIYLAIVVIGSILMGYLMANIHVYLPKFFPEPASFPYLDAFTTVMSFVATILMAHKKLDCWYLWITVDCIGIGLYYSKGVVLISLLYVLFLFLATKGLFNWKKIMGADIAYAPGYSNR